MTRTTISPMSDVHIIRLRGPWEYLPLARTWTDADAVRRESTADLPPPGRVHLPADWEATLGADFRGRVRYTRRFGLPTNLEPHERVWLVIEGVDYFGSLALNGTSLGEIVGYQSLCEFDVTRLLAERNSLSLDVELPQVDEAPDSAGQALAEHQPIHRPGRERLPGGPIGEIRLEIRAG